MPTYWIQVESVPHGHILYTADHLTDEEVLKQAALHMVDPECIVEIGHD